MRDSPRPWGAAQSPCDSITRNQKRRAPMITLNLNGKDHQLDVTEDMPLLWAIRDVVGYTGTKFGCGMGLCGSCTIHIDGQATRSCITPVSLAQGRKVTTIGLNDIRYRNSYGFIHGNNGLMCRKYLSKDKKYR